MCIRIGLMALAVVLVPWLAAGAQDHAPKVSAEEYEGWRQYSVQCARCHGQDVTGNPVAANLLESVGPDGPVADKEAFSKVVAEGCARDDRAVRRCGRADTVPPHTRG